MLGAKVRFSGMERQYPLHCERRWSLACIRVFGRGEFNGTDDNRSWVEGKDSAIFDSCTLYTKHAVTAELYKYYSTALPFQPWLSPMFRSSPHSVPRPPAAVHALRPAPRCPLYPCSPSYPYHCVGRIHPAPSSGYDSAIPWGICAAGSMLGQETHISYVTRRRIARCKSVRTCQETQGKVCLQRTGLLHLQLPSWMLRPVRWRI